MKAELVLIDTSVWIEFFNRPGGKAAQTIIELIRRRRAAIAGVVLTELLQGIRGCGERELVEEKLGSLEYFEVDYQVWRGAGLQLQKLRAQGVTVPLTDAVLAELCRERGAALYSLDRHFDYFKELKRHRP